MLPIVVQRSDDNRDWPWSGANIVDLAGGLAERPSGYPLAMAASVRDASAPGVAERDASGASLHPPGSRLLHGVDRIASRPHLAVPLVLVDVLWVIFSITVGFPARLETVFQTIAAAVTLAMLFVIQHTQARQEAVTQRKLDEILRALPAADNSMISLEAAPDSELRAAAQIHRATRDRANG